MALTLRPTLWLADGPGLAPRNETSVPIQYEVEGMRTGHFASIAMRGGRWQILLRTDEISGGWTGSYDSADAALAALETQTSS